MTQEDGGAVERNAEQVPVMDYAPRQALSLGKLAIGMLAVEVFAVIAFGWSDWRSRRWPIGTPPEMESSFFAACAFVVGMAAAVGDDRAAGGADLQSKRQRFDMAPMDHRLAEPGDACGCGLFLAERVSG